MSKFHSDISGFYKLSLGERQKALSELVNLDDEEVKLLKNFGYFEEKQIDTFIENVVGSYQLPIGIACNFRINNKDYLIPMVIEESSVVAAASNAFRKSRFNYDISNTNY